MKKRFTLSAAALTALTLVATAAPAFADSATGAVTTPGSSSSTTSWTSNTGVTFNAPDPSTPLPPITIPTEPPTTITPQPGKLSLDYASDLDFGIHTVDGATTDFKAGTSSTSNSQASPLVTWHDLDGVQTNYTISAQASALSGLNSATITLGSATFSNISGNGATDTSSLADVAGSHTLNSQPQTIVSSTGAVSGYYADKFADATLSVPVANQSAGTHTGTITWNLTVAP